MESWKTNREREDWKYVLWLSTNKLKTISDKSHKGKETGIEIERKYEETETRMG